jgi:hypothetical protein
VKLEEVQKMTDEELNRNVAELCGGVWKTCECVGINCDKTMRWHWLNNTITNECPNYAGDLNAMHEAESILVEVQKRKYGNILLDITHPDEYYGEYDVVHASARKRAEAFVATMGEK